MNLVEFLRDNTNTRNEKAMVAASLCLLKEVFPGQEICAQCPGEPKPMPVAGLLDGLASLPPGATLTLDSDAGKCDIETSDGEWIGGLRLRGEHAGQFYSAASVKPFFGVTSHGGKP